MFPLRSIQSSSTEATILFCLFLCIILTPIREVKASDNVSSSTSNTDEIVLRNPSETLHNNTEHITSFPRSLTTPELTDEEKNCPECVIQREVLDKLPPAIYPPRGKDGQPMNLLTKIVVKELMDMSVKTETLTMMVWIRMYWYNHDINWDVSRLNVKEIRVTSKQVRSFFNKTAGSRVANLAEISRRYRPISGNKT